MKQLIFHVLKIFACVILFFVTLLLTVDVATPVPWWVPLVPLFLGVYYALGFLWKYLFDVE